MGQAAWLEHGGARLRVAVVRVDGDVDEPPLHDLARVLIKAVALPARPQG